MAPYDTSTESPEEEEAEYEGFELDRYKGMWRQWVDNYAEARRQSFKDQEYYDGDVKGTGEGHWTRAELGVLASRNQPPSVFNLIKRKVNAIAGVEQRSRAEPRALPRTPKDQYAAEIATDALRFVKEQTRLPMTSGNGFMDALISGYAATLIEGAEDHVNETAIDWRDFFFDPVSRRWDFEDAGFLGTAKWLDVGVALATYVPEKPEQPEIPPQPMDGDPEAAMVWALEAQRIIAAWQKECARCEEIEAIINSTASGTGSGSIGIEDGYQDHPANQFCDHKRQRIFVIDMWHKDPKRGWFRCVFTGAGKLFTEEASLVERDQWGRQSKTHPIKAFSLYVSKDGWRYGEVRGMRSPQDEVNMRRSKALHLLTVNQLFYEPGAFADGDVEKARTELARPDGVIATTDVSKIKVERNVELAAGQQQLGAEARAFMEMEGPNPQLQGEQGRATSGRAVLALQQAGLGQLGPIFNRFHDWEDRRYRAMWYRVQQFWTAPMYVRVTDDKNSAKFAAVNGAPMIDGQGNPVPRQRPSAPPMMPTPAGPNGPMGLSPGAMMMPGGSDMMGQAPPSPDDFETGPMLAELDMDIIIDRAPEAATLQAEQYESLVQLAQSGVLGPPNPDVARMLITASALPTKSELLDMLDKIAQQPKGPTPEQKAALAKLAAEIEKLRSEAEKNRASIPGMQANAAKTDAEARSANVNATMEEFSAADALDAYDQLAASLMAGPAMNGPMAAASLPGAPGLPPSQANGPPPF